VVFARDAVERLAVERFAEERLADERFALERALLRDDPELDFDAPPLVFAVLAFDPEFDFAAAGTFFVSATRTLSKSLSACLLVFAASRRRAVKAEVTSL